MQMTVTSGETNQEKVALRVSLQIDLVLERVEWRFCHWLEAYHVSMNGELIGIVARDARDNGPWSVTSHKHEIPTPGREYARRDDALAVLVRVHWQQRTI